MSDPSIDAARRLVPEEFGADGEPVSPRGVVAVWSAREALKPIQQMVDDQLFHGRGPHSQEWWDGAQYILAELQALIRSSEELS